jgi:hypothetical protein
MESLLRPTAGDIVKHKRSTYKLAPTDASRYSDIQNALMLLNRLDYRLSNLDNDGDTERPKRQKQLMMRELKQLMGIVKAL